MAEVPRGTHLKKGIAASVGIHLAALAVLGRFAFHPDADAPAPEPSRAYLEISLSTKPAPPPRQSRARDEFPVPAYSAENSTAGESTAEEEAPLPDPAPSQAVEASIAREERDTPEVTDAPAGEAATTAGSETLAGDGTAGISVTALQSSITGFMQGYRGELKQEWLSECERYKNRHGTRECPAENPALERAPRDYLQADRYAVLEGPAAETLYAMFQNTVNARNREVLRGEGTIALAGTGPSLLGVALSFLGKGSFMTNGARRHFNFTEYEPGRPEQDEEAEDRGFEIQGPLLRAD